MCNESIIKIKKTVSPSKKTDKGYWTFSRYSHFSRCTCVSLIHTGQPGHKPRDRNEFTSNPEQDRTGRPVSSVSHTEETFSRNPPPPSWKAPSQPCPSHSKALDPWHWVTKVSGCHCPLLHGAPLQEQLVGEWCHLPLCYCDRNHFNSSGLGIIHN